MIRDYSLKALQLAINQALALDPQSAQRLAALHGKALSVTVSPLHVQFYISFDQQQLILSRSLDREPDTYIQSSPIGLIRLSLLPGSKARSLFNDKIHIRGDMELGQAVKALFDELDIDWEGHLAYFTGDVVAHQLGSLVNKGLKWTQQFSQSMQDNLNEYVHEELQLSPGPAELADFYQDVDQLALDVERLEAKIKQLQG